MKVGVVRERAPSERRVALVPELVGKYQAAGLEVLVEAGAGAGALIPDSAYAEAGATVVSTEALYAQADIVLRVAKPDADEVASLRPGQAVVGLLTPLIDPATAKTLADRQVTAISLDALPRTLSSAQTMDALSSQANVGGYKAVLIAAAAYGRYFPLLTTAAGTAKPANVLILGIGVAGCRPSAPPVAWGPSSRPTTCARRRRSRPSRSAPASSSSSRPSTRPAKAAMPGR